MKHKVTGSALIGLLLVIITLSLFLLQIQAAPVAHLTIVDIDCKSPPVEYNTDEYFSALVTNDGTNPAYNVKVAFWVDGMYRGTTKAFTVNPESETWSPFVNIHWPSDYLPHKVTARFDAPYSGERSEWFWAQLQ